MELSLFLPLAVESCRVVRESFGCVLVIGSLCAISACGFRLYVLSLGILRESFVPVHCSMIQ